MPPSARKSSVGAARRAVQKSHVPYRGDDPTVGKRTGISVQPVARGSDGFEPFDQLMGQLSEHEPLKKKKKKKKSVPQDEEDDEDDENGEMSMDVDSPIQNYSNTRPPNTPRTPRPIARTSEIDFDQVPSPRPYGSGGRTAGPSRLAKTAQELLDQDEDEEDYGGGGSGFDDYARQDSGSPREVSFTEMDTREEDEEEDEEQQQPVASPTRGKGKGKEKAREDVEDMEDEIMRGMDDVDMAPQSDEEAPPASPPKKAPAKSKPAPKSRAQKENRERLHDRDVPDGVRRSRRVPYAPLDWWRLERVEYGGRDPNGSPIFCPTIKAIIRIPKEPVIPLGKQGRAARARARKRSTTPQVVEKIVEVPVEVPSANPEEGWDDGTETDAVVKSYPDGADVLRRVAFTAKMFAPVAAANNEWFFQKVFNDPDFVAAGQLLIPPKGRKPSKGTKDNTFIFFVIEGAVNLKVCETSLIVASGGMFMVPRGNTYFIENIGDRDAKLFFTQARKLRENEPDEAQRGSSSGVIQQPGRAPSVAGNGGRSGSKQLNRGMSNV